MRTCVAVVLLCHFAPTRSAVLSGRVQAAPDAFSPDAANRLHFLGKFCMSNVAPHYGEVALHTHVRSGTRGTNILLFDDTKWPAVWAARESMTCGEVMGRANSANFQHEADIDGLPIGISQRRMQLFDAVRPHFWYAAAINCRGPLDLSYTLTFTQPDGSRVSFDLQGCRTAYAILLGGMLAVLFAHGHVHRWRFPAAAGVTRLTTWALLLVIATSVCKIVHLSVLARDGQGLPVMDALGDLMHAAASVVLASILLLVAHGWATITGNVSEAAASAVTTCLVALALAHIVYLANAWWFVDVAAVAYPYESPPGYLAVVLQGGVMIYFGRTLARGVREEASPTRRRFLLQVLAVGLAWFATVPVSVVIASLMDPYLRAKVVAIMRVLVDASFVAALVWLVAPARQDQFFQQAPVPIYTSAFSPFGDGASGYDHL